MLPEPRVECPVCKMPLVEGCRNAPGILGGGIIHKIRGDDLVAVTCPNLAVVRLKQKMIAIDPQLIAAKHDRTTPLYQKGEVDRTHDNIIFKNTSWPTFLGHLKWVVASKDMFLRLTSDMTLVNVYVGNTALKARLKAQIERGEDGDVLISNSIEDLLAGPDLVIIRLGQLVHFNRAAANVLHEALLLRLSQGKATWLVEPTWLSFSPWTKSDFGIPTGMPCCNQDVLALVNRQFDEVHLPSRGDDDAPGVAVDDTTGDDVIEGPSDFGENLPEDAPDELEAEPRESPSPRRAAVRTAKSLEDEIDALMGPKKKFPSKYGKGRF